MSKTVVINQFDGGITGDSRDPRTTVARIIENFDIFTDKYKLTPNPSSESGDSSASTNNIANYAYDGATVYGLGRSEGTGPSSIMTRTNFTDAIWSALYGNLGGSNRADADIPFFTYYKTTVKLYGVRGGRYVWSAQTDGGGANTSEADLTAYSTVSNGLVHSKDDILYVGYNNKIASNNNGSWTVAALTLPSSYIITSISEFGNNLAIGCRPTGGGNSRTFLWDRNSSVTTLSESVDWGEGNLTVLEELEGYLIGVSFEGTTGSYNLKSRMVCRYYTGSGGAVKFAEAIGNSQTPTGVSANFKCKNHSRILFPAAAPIDTTGYFGIWSIGRSSQGVPFALSLEYNLLTAFSGSLTLYGLIKLGDYLFASYTVNSNWYLDKTDDTSVYTTKSVIETTINPGMSPLDRVEKKQLVSAGLMYEALPAAGQAILQYRVDGGSWTTIFTETTDGVVYTEPYPNANGTQFTKGKEYEFHAESTGGAKITAILYKYDIIPSNV